MKFITKLFRKDKPVACADVAVPLAEDTTPPVVEGAPEPVTKGTRGRKLSELALRAHAALAAQLTDEPATRSKLLATLTDETEREYVSDNWQNVIARLVSEGKAKLADGAKARGRGVAYVRVAS